MKDWIFVGGCTLVGLALFGALFAFILYGPSPWAGITAVAALFVSFLFTVKQLVGIYRAHRRLKDLERQYREQK